MVYADVRQARDGGETDPFAVRNHTEMRLRAGMVVAGYDCADEGDLTEIMPVEFLTLLASGGSRLYGFAFRAGTRSGRQLLVAA
jgi:hypothetical protein